MSKKVLLVDDANLLKRILNEIVVSHGYTVCGEASNGLEGFNKYKELKPDIVFMDITMPCVDGLEGLKMITSYDKNAKVIMCTAMGQQSMIYEAVNSGAKDFVIKPFKPKQITDAIDRLCW